MAFSSMTRRSALKLLGASTVTAAAPADWALASPAAADSASTGSAQQSLAVSSARAVLRRLLGARADQFELAWTAAVDGRPVYEAKASNGSVSIQGSSGVAICRGAYMYLREACNAMVTWSGRHLDFPAKFPNYSERRVVSPYQHTQYYNPCTFGYTTPFWNWQRWERELDWMALHGINMPMALDGQEVIWQKVWLAMGLEQADVDRFSTGPARLPWHWFGNINHFNGPLPQGWKDQKAALQKQILARMRELGMTPIVPAFGGYVPEGFKRVYPHARTFTEFWGGEFAPRLSKTFFLDPRNSELFQEIGKRFIQTYNAEFGGNEYYMADPFNELQVPVTKGHRYEDLAAYGKLIYNSVIAGDPKGKWLLQAWCFEDTRFWDPPSVKAFLSQVPDDGMLLIDYGNSFKEIWRANGAYYGKPWIYGMIHTFGGNNNVKGNLPAIDSRPAKVLESPDHGNLVGWGILPEGTETNEVVYELMTDIGWADRQIPLEPWLSSYSVSRYGSAPAEIQQAWKLLLQSAYSDAAYTSYNSRQAFQSRPSLDPKPLGIYVGPIFVQAVEQFVAVADRLNTSELYRNDLIELVCQAAGNGVDAQLQAACEAHKQGDAATRDRKAQLAFSMLKRIDALMNLREDRHLETWVDDAKSWGHNAQEADYYAGDGRLLITFWGWKTLEDYASRVWSGQIRDYYVGRWKTFFKALGGSNPQMAVTRFEQTWLSAPWAPSKPLPVTDLVAEARNMLATSKSWKAAT